MTDVLFPDLAVACQQADELHQQGRNAEAVAILSEVGAQQLEQVAAGSAVVSRGLLQLLHAIMELQRRLGRIADAVATALLLRRLASSAGQPFTAMVAALQGA